MNSRRRASADSAAGGDRGGSDGPPRPPGVRRPTVPIPPSSSDPRLRGGGAPPPIRRARGSFSAQATKGDTKRAVKYARMGLLSQNSRRFYASECASSGDDEGDSLESSEEEEDDDEGGGLESITGEGEEDDGDEEGNASRRPLDFRRSTTTRVAMAAVAARASAAPARRKAEGGAKPGRETTLAKAAIRRPTTEDAVAPRPDDVGPDLLAEGQHYLSISMLVYMYAHLRETCRMGHTRVRLEEMDVNSYQGLYGKAAPEGGGEDVFRGSFSRRKKKKKGRNGGGPKRRGSDESLSTFGSSLGSLTVEPPKYLDKTKSAGQIIRIVIDELGTREGLSGEGGEEGRDESDDLGRDMMGGANSEYERSVLKEFNTWISDSKVSQLDEDTQEAINKLRRQVARQRWKRAKSLITISRVLSKRSNIGELQPSSSAQSLLELDEDKLDANRAQMAHHLRRQVARYRWKRAISRVIIGIRLSRPAFPSWDSAHMNTDKIFVNMKKLMKEALDTQPKYFREGSVMNNLIESGIEVVWFSDLTQNDVVYGICCQRDQGRVAVVFRGTVNSHNWLINMKFSTTPLSNPISDEYPGRSELLDVHTGFSLYMLRRRKDTHTNKIDEIFEMVDAIGREMCPDGNYKLSITGHSLGGALATLLGFYAAASEKFSNVKQIRVFTFAAPRVGASSFFHAYQHLERSGKIRHARFSCTRDLVPNIPPFNLDGFNPIKWRYYKHVGMRIQLHSVGDRAKLRLRQALDVTYPLHHDWLSELVRIFNNNLIVFLNTIKGYKKNHTLTEHQKRLHFASEYRLALSKSVLRNDKRRNHIKSLDEYYCIRANMAADGVSIEDDLNLWNTLRGRIERISKKLLTFVIVFALMCGWLVLVKSVADSLQREDGVNDITSFPHESGELFLSPDKHTQAHALADPDMVASLLADDDAQLQAAESQLKPIKEYATGITFAPKLDDLYLIGAGVRKKSIIKVYAVAMYSSPSVLNGATPATLGKEARSFTSATPMSSFILKMVHGVSAEKIAGAIAESVKPRYDGLESDIEVLESLIVDGVNKIGGQATKGTMFRFDCSEEGVSVSVNGALQGMTSFAGMGSSFVDVFMDDNAVSPSLVSSCLDTWSSEESMALAASLMELNQPPSPSAKKLEEQLAEDPITSSKSIESKLKPLTEYATGVSFAPKLDDLYLVGAGVRKKSIMKIYSVAMYSSAAVLNAAATSLQDTSRTFDSVTPMTTFVLEMVYSVGAEKIAGAIAESVKPRYDGLESDIEVLESLIVDGVNKIGGQATKGTMFRFDCSEEGVSVSVNGALQGMASFEGMGSSFVDVFMDDNAVSPSLVGSCHGMWSGDEAKSMAASLLELSIAAGVVGNGEGVNDEEQAVEGVVRDERIALESQLNPLQEYSTGITFAPVLGDLLYLVGAGVRKKSIVKIYAVAMYSSPTVLSAVSSATLGNAARSFGPMNPMTSFVLDMVYSASAEKIAGAIAESVKPRYSGPTSDIDVLESLIVDGVNKIGGQATKGTVFRFDCSEEGVSVSVNGSYQGVAGAKGLGSAFVDVFVDNKAVSPSLVDNCLDTWSGEEARLLAVSMLELMRDELSEKQVKMAQVSSEEDTERSATDTLLADASDPKSEPSEGVGHTEQDANEMVLADTGDAKTDYEDVEQIDLDGPLASNAELKERSPASLGQGGRELATGEVALVSGEADVNHDLEEEQQAEQTQLPSPTLHNAPPPAPEDLRLNHSSDDDIHPLAKYRARDVILRQRESIMDAVQQSIQQDGGIQTRASDIAAERLRALASHIADDTALDSSASESAKKLVRLIFPIF